MGFGKGGVNRPSTGSFCTRKQQKKGSKHGPASTPAQPRPKRKAAPATLVDKHADEDGLVEQLAIAIDEAETRVAIKVLFVQQHKEPDESQWHGSDGCVPQIAEAVGCHPDTVVSTLTRIVAARDAGEDVDVAVRAAGSGGHNKKIRLGTAAADELIGGLEGGFG
eukprot:COSAG05_NODE_1578_length_4501_cov_2.007269_4_plen_165_part_00